MFQVSTHHWSSQSALFPKQWSDCPKARAAKVKGPQWLNEESPHDHFIARAWTLAQISASSLRRALLSVWASLTCMHFPLLLLSAQCRLRPRLNCVPTRRQNTDHQNHQTQIGLKISLEVHVFQAPARLQTALPILQTYNLSIYFFSYITDLAVTGRDSQVHRANQELRLEPLQPGIRDLSALENDRSKAAYYTTMYHSKPKPSRIHQK